MMRPSQRPLTDSICGLAEEIFLDAFLRVLALEAIREGAHVVVIAQHLGERVCVIESVVAQVKAWSLDDDHGLLEGGASGDVEHPAGEDSEDQGAQG